nr:polyprotein [Nepovirus sp.]
MKYSRDLNRYYTSTYPCGVHDSGGILTTTHQGRRKVVGLHVAGMQPTKGLFRATISFLPVGNFADTHSAPDFFEPASGLKTDGYEKIGWIKDPSYRPHTSSKTQLAPVPPNLCLPLPAGVTVKVPSILGKNDPRLESEVNPLFKDYDPLKNGMEKFAHPMKLLDEDVLKEVCDDIYTDWYDCLPEFVNESGEVEKQFLTKTTLDIALNGIPGDACYDAMKLDTSEGYPHVVRRQPGESGKRRFVFEAEDGHRSLIEGTDVHKAYVDLSASLFKEVPVLNCVECPKDECLKPGKVFDKPGTRLFDTLPFEHNILLREYFLNFCVFLQTHRGTLPCCVGTNPYSREWTRLFDSLAQVSDKALNCDYSKFDGLITHQVYMAMVATINRLFKDGEEANSCRRNLFAMFVGRRSIAYDQVYLVMGGMPSGCALTVIINSVLNEILVRYVFKRVVPTPTRNYFNKYVKLLVYGDDNLIAIDDCVTPYFNGGVIKQEMAQLNITITDGTDKLSPTLESKPLESLDFLKRGFRKLDNGLIAAPLEKSSLYTRLYYTTQGKDKAFQLEILHDNVKSFLEELVLHADSYGEFMRVRDFYIRQCPTWRNTLPSWGVAVASMESQRTLCEPYQVQKMIETRPKGHEFKMMAGQDRLNQSINITERLVICGRDYKPQSLATSFIMALDTPLRRVEGEKGMYVPNEYGSGSGQLPTDRWVQRFKSPKFFKELHEAYDEGKTIYFRSCMPYYLGWCALISFAQTRGISSSSLIALYENYKPKHAGDIAPLVASKEYRRVNARPFAGVHFGPAQLVELVPDALC